MGFITSVPQIHSRFISYYRRAKDIGKPSTNLHFRIPDTLRNWPWRRHLNPHYPVCKMESAAWLETFKAFSPKAQDAFNRCDFSLLASLGLPFLDKAGCRVGCDLMNLFFLFDEHSDVADARCVREQADIIMDALHHPHTARPQGEWVGGEVARQFWENAIKTASPTSQRHFVDSFKLYTDSVVQQAEDRNHNYIRDIQSYFDVRRDTIGLKPSLVICEIHMDLPDYVLADPTIQKLALACLDMVIVGNDLSSYNVEQARGDDGHNLVRVVMHEQGSTLEEALAWISRLHDDLVRTFLEEYEHVSSKWGSPALDAQVAEYVQGLGNWVRANDCWSFESERYFGKEGLEVKNTRVVRILPKQSSTTD